MYYIILHNIILSILKIYIYIYICPFNILFRGGGGFDPV